MKLSSIIVLGNWPIQEQYINIRFLNELVIWISSETTNYGILPSQYVSIVVSKNIFISLVLYLIHLSKLVHHYKKAAVQRYSEKKLL